ncbi:MAG: beta-galactosidase [Acidobacteria bacterium RIFCSPLOWO2_12_FULL_66_21]|nr:MAG: beta-galactosidase [Acidobacteria bacterium RIFCSPLOWO2_12_FULL_66_21]
MRIAAALLLFVLGAASAPAPQRAVLSPSNGAFLLNGRPLQIISGEMHYPRVPREYWRDRMKKARAMGLNTITTYVFWNLHEPRPGTFDFSGNLDVAAYIRTAAEEGLHVIVRPGPYVCSEWDLGGLPAWLLADPSVVVRSTDEQFMSAARRYLARVGRELAPLQSGRGGPIIAVQVENEYGSFDNDHDYMRAVHDATVSAGFTDAMLFTADGPGQLPAGTLPGVAAVVNFGPGGAERAFAALAKFRPGAPLMSGEYWAGWFDHWGRPHHTTDRGRETRELGWMLAQGHSLNFYMFHGGTTFGFMNGANDDGGYLPQTSSYDYDAALDESGRPAAKFTAFRDVIARHTGAVLPPLPPDVAPSAVARFELKESASLVDHLGKPVTADRPRPMEELGQSYGYILYRTRLGGPVHGEIVVTEVRDFAAIFVNGRRAGTLDRRLKQDRLRVDSDDREVVLDLLVENTGRINFKKVLRGERKGITRSVALDGRELSGWSMYPLPMADLSRVRYGRTRASGPAFHRGTFEVGAPADTFLDLRGWGKGTVWVNGHHLGRFWSIGPQQTLYLPAPWLKRGRNTIVVFDLEVPERPSIEGLTVPVLNEVKKD